METISIIIPVYNMERYLERCLTSIISQTYENIEIILVNDGSADHSLDICNKFQEEDNRIKVIDKINEGVSVARNTGIINASGQYIGFVDPDDWIEPNMYESMYNTIKKYNCNIAFCNYTKDNKISSSQRILKVKKDVLGKLDIINELIGNMVGFDDIFPKYSYVMGCVWRCLYKKDFIEKYNLRFKPGITIMEDLIFNIEALIYCDKVCIDRGIYYHYMKNKSSVLHTYNEKLWRDQLVVHETLETLLKEADLDEYLRNRLDSRYITMAACALGNEVYLSDANIKDRLEAVKYILNDKKLKLSLERVKKYNFENFRYLRNKEEKEDIERENKLIKMLLSYINPFNENEKCRKEKGRNL